MSLLNKASLILTPNAYKASKLYSIIPTNGNGDMTVLRNTSATRDNSSGLVELVGNNIPRLEYDGSCPSILLEPQRTNLLVNSVWAGGGSIPTGWSSLFSTGTSTAVASIKNPNVSAYRFVTSTQRQEFYQNITLAVNSITTISVYVESVTTPIIVSQMLRVSASAGGTGTVVYLKNNVVINSSTNVEAGNTYSLQFTCTIADTFQTRFGVGVGVAVTGDITLSMPQVERGATPITPIAAYSTSFIPTTTTALTRNADTISRDNIFSNGLITAAGGTWFVELNNNFALTRDAAGTFQIGDLSGNNISIKTTASNSRLAIVKNILGNQTVLYTTLTNIVKIAIKWNGTKLDIFVNGAKINLSEINRDFTTTNMDSLTTSIADVPRYVKSMMLFPAPLTDTECINLTTL